MIDYFLPSAAGAWSWKFSMAAKSRPKVFFGFFFRRQEDR